LKTYVNEGERREDYRQPQRQDKPEPGIAAQKRPSIRLHFSLREM
jgi:hypothetical protein